MALYIGQRDGTGMFMPSGERSNYETDPDEDEDDGGRSCDTSCPIPSRDLLVSMNASMTVLRTLSTMASLLDTSNGGSADLGTLSNPEMPLSASVGHTGRLLQELHTRDGPPPLVLKSVSYTHLTLPTILLV